MSDRRATWLTIAALLAAGLSGCGGSSGAVGDAAGVAHREPYRDGDDETVLNYGRPADRADARAVTALVERYYAAAAAGDGASACALTAPNLAQAIPAHYEEELGSNAPPDASELLRGARTCADTLSRLFKRLHAELATPVVVTGVRLKGSYGYGLVGSATLPATFVAVGREGGSWQIDGLLGRPVP